MWGNTKISVERENNMYYSTSWLSEGDEVKVIGWRRPKILVEIIERGLGWLVGMFSDGENLEYAVIEDYEIVAVAKSGKGVVV